MTGYGKAAGDFNGKKISVELRSLNSKGVDLNVRMSSLYREKELELRNELSRLLERGKIDVNIFTENTGTEAKSALNKNLLLNYYKELKSISEEIGENDRKEFLSLLLNMPDVMQSTREELDEKEWAFITQLTKQAIEQFVGFRKQEGAVLANELKQRINLILSNLEQVEKLAEEKKTVIRTKLFTGLKELSEKMTIDQNRFEQEVIYYLEKLDITEERVRLRAHCNYFIETMNLPSNEGKKFGFIAQEIGREINTIGSKCNDAEIQRYVVQMKDELEKIKEQSLNVL